MESIVRRVERAIRQTGDAVDPGFSAWLQRALPEDDLRALIARAFKSHPTVGPILRVLAPRLFDARWAAAEERDAGAEIDWAIVAARSGPGHWQAWLDAFKPADYHGPAEQAGWVAFLDAYAPTGIAAVQLALGPLDEFDIVQSEAGRGASLSQLIQTPEGRARVAQMLRLEPARPPAPAAPQLPARRGGPTQGVYAVLLGHREDASALPSHLRPHQVLPGIAGQQVRTLREASQAVNLFVRGTGMGGSAEPREFGIVVDPTNHAIAKVSYNGRVWRVPYVPFDQVPMYEPGRPEITGPELDAVLGASGVVEASTSAGAGPGPWDDVLDKTRRAEFEAAVRKYGIPAQTLWEIAVLYRAEWNIPWHSAFSFARDYLVTPRGQDIEDPDVVLEHSVGTGTLFATLARQDNDIAKALGMNWSRREGFWYRASSRGRQLPTVALSRVVDLAHKKGLTVQLDITPPPGLEAAREAYRQAKEARAEVYEARAAKHAAASEAAYQAQHRIGQAIPMGQPILVGHHSEKRHRRDIERMHQGMRKSIEEEKAAGYAASRAATVAAQAEHYAPGRRMPQARGATGREGVAVDILAGIKARAKWELQAPSVMQHKHRGVLVGYVVGPLPPRPGEEAWQRKRYALDVFSDGTISVADRYAPGFPTRISLGDKTPEQAVTAAFDEVRRRYADPAYSKAIPVGGIDLP